MITCSPTSAIAIIAVASTLTACGQRYEAPESAIVVPTSQNGTSLGSKSILLRAFYNPGSAISEINNATCTVSAGSSAVRVTPPVQLSVNITEGNAPSVAVTCDATIGPREVTGTFQFDPLIPAPTSANSVDEVYSDRINIRFF